MSHLPFPVSLAPLKYQIRIHTVIRRFGHLLLELFRRFYGRDWRSGVGRLGGFDSTLLCRRRCGCVYFGGRRYRRICLNAIDRAVQLGPTTCELYSCAALLYALPAHDDLRGRVAAQTNPSSFLSLPLVMALQLRRQQRIEHCLSYVSQAIVSGDKNSPPEPPTPQLPPLPPFSSLVSGALSASRRSPSHARDQLGFDRSRDTARMTFLLLIPGETSPSQRRSCACLCSGRTPSPSPRYCRTSRRCTPFRTSRRL